MIQFSTGLRDYCNATGSFKDALANGVIDCYTTSQPADADSAETGVFICRFTLAAGDFTSGVSTNGLNFGVSSEGVLAKAAAEEWSTSAEAAGTVGWFRFYANTVVTGDSTTAIRFDGSISTSVGANLQLTNLTFAIAGGATLSTFNVTFPAA